jgi:hypothetical protein
MDQEQVDLPVAQFVRDSVKLALLQVAGRNAQCIFHPLVAYRQRSLPCSVAPVFRPVSSQVIAILADAEPIASLEGRLRQVIADSSQDIDASIRCSFHINRKRASDESCGQKNTCER